MPIRDLLAASGIVLAAAEKPEKPEKTAKPVRRPPARKKIPLTPDLVAKAAAKAGGLHKIHGFVVMMNPGKSTPQFRPEEAASVLVKAFDAAESDWRKKRTILHTDKEVGVIEHPEHEVAWMFSDMVAVKKDKRDEDEEEVEP